MGGVTGGGYPYPVGTEFVRDGDNAIQALALATDARAGALLECVNAASQNIASGAWASVSCGGTPTAERDPLGLIRTDAQSPLVDVAGWWDILVVLRFAANSTGRRFVGWYTSNSGTPSNGAQSTVSAGGSTGPLTLALRDLALISTVPARVMPYAFQDSGATLAVSYARVLARYVSAAALPS